MSVTIKYNGSNVATVEGGKTATLPVENKKMVTDIIVTVPESKGEVLPDHTESDFTLQLANIASGELGVVYSSTEKVAFDAAPNGEVIDTFVDTNFLPSNIKKDVEIFGVMGEYGGDETGGASADDRVKYVTYMDRGAELIKYPVIEGDTARDPVAKGYIEKPTKEPTESTVYTQNGWSKTDGGAPDSTALQNVTEDRTVYAAYTESVRKYTIRFFDDDGSILKTQQYEYGAMPTYTPEKDGYLLVGWTPEISAVTADIDYTAVWEESLILEATSWERISEISAEGTAENYWSVGDKKSVQISGQIGIMPVDMQVNTFILGFNHNSELEGTGIHFGFTRILGDANCASNSSSGTAFTDGTKTFNMNHWGAKNYGGWAGCDLRYDILGSTDKAPSGYGYAASSGRTGNNPTATCATTPKSNTFMAALPANLRAVMKPMTKYTNNTQYSGSTDKEEYITASIDYLPLPAVTEINGENTTYANDFESKYTAQYSYYSSGGFRYVTVYDGNGNSKNMYTFWYRSLAESYNDRFVLNSGSNLDTVKNLAIATVSKSCGIAPIFKV